MLVELLVLVHKILNLHSKGDRLAIFFLEENHHIVEEDLFTGLLFLKLLLQQSALCSKLPLAPLRRLLGE